MRAMLSIVSLLLVVWLVMTLTKRQMETVMPVPAATGSPPGQSPRQIQQQYQEALDKALQQNQRQLDAVNELER